MVVDRRLAGVDESLAERFWRHVEKSDNCWQWTGTTRKPYGYGLLWPGNGNRSFLRAHRVSWEIANGGIPDGKYVCHSCDNNGCVNPDHLFLSDQPKFKDGRTYGAGWVSVRGYHTQFDKRSGRGVPTHRIVWERRHGVIPDGIEIHHINGDKLDNRIENLQALSGADHRRLHMSRLRSR